MSKGHCGWMKLLAEDEQQLWYQYRSAYRQSDCGHFVEKGFCIFHCQPRLTVVKNVRNGFGCGRNLPARAAKPRDTNVSQRDCGPSDTSLGTLLMICVVPVPLLGSGRGGSAGAGRHLDQAHGAGGACDPSAYQKTTQRSKGDPLHAGSADVFCGRYAGVRRGRGQPVHGRRRVSQHRGAQLRSAFAVSVFSCVSKERKHPGRCWMVCLTFSGDAAAVKKTRPPPAVTFCGRWEGAFLPLGAYFFSAA